MAGRVSGLKSLDVPAIAFPHIFKAVVKPAGSTLPELDTVGNDAITAPETGQGHFAIAEFAFDLGHFLFQQSSGGNSLALFGNPGANLAASWPRREVAQGLSLAHFFNGALDPYLSVQSDPGEQQGRLGVFLHLPGLPTAVVGVEDKTLAVEVLQQYRAQVRHAIPSGGCQRHGVGFENACLPGVLKPALELPDRITVQRIAIQPLALEITTHIADVHNSSSNSSLIGRVKYDSEAYRVQACLSALLMSESVT